MQDLINSTSFLIIPLGLFGFGALITINLTGSKKFSLGISLALGLSLMIFMCGYLELFRLASINFFTNFISLGVLFSIIFIVKILAINALTHHPLKKFTNTSLMARDQLLTNVTASLIYFLAIIATFSYFYTHPLNVHDDFSGYLVLCNRILQEGFQGADFFNDRSIEQGFGAGNYINALARLFLPNRALNLADSGIGIALLSLLIIDSFKDSTTRKSFPFLITCLILCCAIVINSPIVNISPIIIPCGLFIASMSFYIKCDYGNNFCDHFFLALLLSSFLVLKGNYIIPVCATSLSIYVSRFTITKSSRALTELGIFVVCMLFFTFPWMIANWQFAKTPFYPLLGFGLVTPNALGLASLAQFTDSITALAPYYAVLIGLLAFLYRFKRDLDCRLFFFIYFLSITVIVLSCIFTMTSAGSLTRYSYVSLFGPIAFLSVYILANISLKGVIGLSKHSPENILTIIFLLCLTTPMLLDTMKRSSRALVKAFSDANLSASHYFFTPNEQLRIDLLQNSLPLGSVVLLRLDTPFLINFSKGKFHVMDWPGNVGPKPGVPFKASPEELAQYLRDQGIQYVSYSYRNEALFSISDSELSSREYHTNPWIQTQAVRTFAVQKQLQSLGQHYYRVYDNGQDFVIDLSRRAAP